MVAHGSATTRSTTFLNCMGFHKIDIQSEDVTIQFDTQETLSCHQNMISNIMCFDITQTGLKLSPNFHCDTLNTLTSSDWISILWKPIKFKKVVVCETRLFTVTNSEYEFETLRFEILRSEIWIWNLNLKFESEIWIRNLNLKSESEIWTWNLKSEI